MRSRATALREPEQPSPAPSPEPPRAPIENPPAPQPKPEPAGSPVRALKGRPLELVDQPRFGFHRAKKAEPAAERTIEWWALKKKYPAWIVAAMSQGQPVNKEFSEPEVEDLAQKVAALPLGRKGA